MPACLAARSGCGFTGDIHLGITAAITAAATAAAATAAFATPSNTLIALAATHATFTTATAAGTVCLLLTVEADSCAEEGEDGSPRITERGTHTICKQSYHRPRPRHNVRGSQ